MGSIETIEASPAVEAEQVQEPPIESKFGRIVYPKSATKPITQNEEARPQLDRVQSADVHNPRSHPAKSDRDSSGAKTEALGSQEGDRVLAVARDFKTGRGRVLPDQSIKLDNFSEADRLENEQKMSQSAIEPATKNLPGSRSKASTAHQLLELFKSSAHIIEDSPGVKTEATVSESAIAPAAKNRIDDESDQNPILTGIPLSDRFVTRYTPPQPEIIHFQSDADGQLSLLDFEVESVEEPPDPDDFESLDAFREAIARWDWEHPSSFDHCSDHLPSSVPNELPLQVSLDSFCLWAHCPDDWYEPAVLLEPSKVLELSSVRKTSITSDFFIPTFGGLGDRSNRRDEPPDTGIFARLPKPKPPTFPPQASQPGIPKLFHRVVAGSSTQPARSPPGGDA
jgi:hypothetical protein